MNAKVKVGLYIAVGVVGAALTVWQIIEVRSFKSEIRSLRTSQGVSDEVQTATTQHKVGQITPSEKAPAVAYYNYIVVTGGSTNVGVPYHDPRRIMESDLSHETEVKAKKKKTPKVEATAPDEPEPDDAPEDIINYGVTRVYKVLPGIKSISIRVDKGDSNAVPISVRFIP